MVMELLVRPLSTVDNTRDYARVSHSRQWSNYNTLTQYVMAAQLNRRKCRVWNSRGHVITLPMATSEADMSAVRCFAVCCG